MAVGSAIIGAGASLYGAKRNRDEQRRVTEQNNELADAQTERALVNLRPGYEQAQQTQRQSYGRSDQINQEALERAMLMRRDVFMPQMQAYEGGNLAAQEANLAALPAMRAAILGGRMPEMIKPKSLPINTTALEGLMNPTAQQFSQRRERPMRQGGMRGNMQAGSQGGYQGMPQMDQVELMRLMQQEQMYNDRPAMQFERPRYEIP